MFYINMCCIAVSILTTTVAIILKCLWAEKTHVLVKIVIYERVW